MEWTNPDPLTWRIKLREGVKWHKGFGEVTAEDVAYAWNFHIEYKNFQVGTALFPVDSVKAVGKYVVEVKPSSRSAPSRASPWATAASSSRRRRTRRWATRPTRNAGSATVRSQIESKRGTEIKLVSAIPTTGSTGLPKLDKIV